MIDKTVIINDNEALILFTERPPVRVTHDSNVRAFLTWMGIPNAQITLEEFISASATVNESTKEINRELF